MFVSALTHPNLRLLDQAPDQESAADKPNNDHPQTTRSLSCHTFYATRHGERRTDKEKNITNIAIYAVSQKRVVLSPKLREEGTDRR